MPASASGGAEDVAGLADLLRSGDLVATERLVATFGTQVFHLLAQTTGSWDAAEALVTPAFLAVWRDRARVPRDADLPAFVLGHAAGIAREVPAPQLPDPDLAGTLAPLASLAPTDRAAWVLHHWHALSPAQVALALHLGRRPASEVLARADQRVGEQPPWPGRRPLPGSIADRTVLALADEPAGAAGPVRLAHGRRTALMAGGVAVVAAALLATVALRSGNPATPGPSTGGQGTSLSPAAFDAACRQKAADYVGYGRADAPRGSLHVDVVDPARPALAELLHDDSRRFALCTGNGSITFPDATSPWPLVSLTLDGSNGADLVAAGPVLPHGSATDQPITVQGTPVDEHDGWFTWHQHPTGSTWVESASGQSASGKSMAVVRGGVPERTFVVPWSSANGPTDLAELPALSSMDACRHDPRARGMSLAVPAGDGGLMFGAGLSAICVGGQVQLLGPTGQTRARAGVDDALGDYTVLATGIAPAGTTSVSLESSMAPIPGVVDRGHWVLAMPFPLTLAGTMPLGARVVLWRGTQVLKTVPVVADQPDLTGLPGAIPALLSGSRLTGACAATGAGGTVTSSGGHVLVLRRENDVVACAADVFEDLGAKTASTPEGSQRFALQTIRPVAEWDTTDSSAPPIVLFGGGTVPDGVTSMRFLTPNGEIAATIAHGLWAYEQLSVSGSDESPTAVILDGSHVHRTVRLR